MSEQIETVEDREIAPRRVVIAGGHGKVARYLIKALTAHGDRAVALIRDPAQAHEVEAFGALSVVLDLENAEVDEVVAALGHADAAVFAAGSGAGSGAARKDSVDRAGAVLLADAAEAAGVPRFVQISSMGAGEAIPEGTDEVFAAYLRAKTAAEDDLRGRTGLEWTILRPGRLQDTDATGLVTLSEPPADAGEVSRGDVAAVVFALIGAPNTIGKTLVLTSGSTPVDEAVAEL
ncbi:SDR family oxidoreductase [Rhodococcus triatomae]|uniref:NAD(P)H-binding n=1 Tax=Rhodococcus triatomae TaxID=300028 RepID=A0A1G8A6B3_9NOCA|nr:SDR family oxidoreductase [Rhodococcus triatomae]QNG17858.1 SDR family oxidoreductase [Rhodococcus triatomae]QNG22474.1 SDR family oxidoreductase [Rhodococcus triatomae]SDH15930.1 NAD(P)H-binding [Rhodococcus triatomae]